MIEPVWHRDATETFVSIKAWVSEWPDSEYPAMQPVPAEAKGAGRAGWVRLRPGPSYGLVDQALLECNVALEIVR
ncbi:hypothetical protein [Parachitinimonas caeni]|uniref:Uncharacterized protein n=1 Tax=Parachitinimonas caeni TaxID=3031301 RepID=A0ABT7E3P8_9NEIS|nr:hypothetical protein [Parachitinimonas caeni]MDK2126947.1 hypothetical protein [Parachitinimonas caeni]